MTLYTADTHFYHTNIIKYCNRPFADIDEMNETIIRNWNNKVKPEDVVYHLGDVSFRNLDIMKRLNGSIILIRGNHDRGFTTRQLQRAGIIYVHRNPTSIVVGVYRIFLMHAPVHEDLESTIYLCGHVHDKWKKNGLYHNVGVDVRDFTPVTLEEILR